MSPADLEPLALIAAEVAAEWGVELGPPFALSRYSYVAPAGEDAVLKVTPPGGRRVGRGGRRARAVGRRRRRAPAAPRPGTAGAADRARLPGRRHLGLPEDEATAIAVAVGTAAVAAGGGAVPLDRRPRSPLARPGGALRSGRARPDPVGARALRLARRSAGRRSSTATSTTTTSSAPATATSRSTPRRCSASRSTTSPRSSGTRSGRRCGSTCTERRLAAFAAAGLDQERMRAWAVIRGAYLGSDAERGAGAARARLRQVATASPATAPLAQAAAPGSPGD